MSNGACSIDSTTTFCFSLNLKVYLSSKFVKAQSFSMFVLSILQREVTYAHTRKYLTFDWSSEPDSS